MKITKIDTFVVKSIQDLVWIFCAIRTDTGITGYSEFGTGVFKKGLPGLVQDIGSALIGKDARETYKDADNIKCKSALLSGLVPSYLVIFLTNF